MLFCFSFFFSKLPLIQLLLFLSFLKMRSPHKILILVPTSSIASPSPKFVPFFPFTLPLLVEIQWLFHHRPKSFQIRFRFTKTSSSSSPTQLCCCCVPGLPLPTRLAPSLTSSHRQGSSGSRPAWTPTVSTSWPADTFRHSDSTPRIQRPERRFCVNFQFLLFFH